MICDMCIVHLNVAYNFKRQAVENDVKLRQYLIEQGLCAEPESISSIPHSSVIYSSNISVIQDTTNRSNTVLPIIIKTEPVENNVPEVIPDDVTEVCVEMDLFTSPTLAPTIQISEVLDGGQDKNGETPSTARPLRKATPSPTPSMVIINGNNLCDPGDIRTPERESRDTEFMRTYVANVARTNNQIINRSLLPDTPSTSTNNSPPSVKSTNTNPPTKTPLSMAITRSHGDGSSNTVDTNTNSKKKLPMQNDLKWMMKLSLQPRRSKVKNKLSKEQSNRSKKKPAVSSPKKLIRSERQKERQIKKKTPVSKILKGKKKIGTILKAKLKETGNSVLGRGKRNAQKSTKADKSKETDNEKKKTLVRKTVVKKVLVRRKTIIDSLPKNKVILKSKVGTNDNHKTRIHKKATNNDKGGM